jgi:hypothetical protein
VPQAQACAATWTQRTFATATPTARSRPGFAYDAARGQIVLFGGNTATGAVADTWTYDGAQWLQHTTAVAPTARRAVAMDYDPLRQVIILYGGCDATCTTGLSDTWTWNGTSWTQLAATGPGPRTFGEGVWDSIDSSFRVFGGWTGTTALNDVWDWDGASWSAPTLGGVSMPGIADFAMYMSPSLGLVIFGGESGIALTAGTIVGETRILSGGLWSALATGPLKRAGGIMAYDSGHSLGVLFGGYDPAPATGTAAYYNDTQAFNGGSWVQVFANGLAASPPARYRHAMAYDPRRHVIVLFGGLAAAGYLGDTWEMSW